MEDIIERKEGESCQNCISYWQGIGIGQGLRCSSPENRDNPVEGLVEDPGRIPLIPNRNFWCEHYSRRSDDGE